MSKKDSNNSYDSKDIKILEGLEAVRKRPAMYIGSTGPNGLHHLIWEVLDNSVDEAMAGRCSKIKVSLEKNGSVTVEDDGSGIPVKPHPKTKISALTTVLTHFMLVESLNQEPIPLVVDCMELEYLLLTLYQHTLK